MNKHHPANNLTPKGDYLKNKNVWLAVTGSVSCVESVGIARELIRYGANVTIVANRAALELVGEKALEFACGKPIIKEITGQVEHVIAGHDADLLIVAPCCATSLGKMVHGFGDNPQGRQYDQFPDNPTQWEDNDGDGLGDNQTGTNADPYLNDFDNDGYNDSVDILPKLASPGDLDADGCLDEVDLFPDNPQECFDTDGDGIGNNADADDDGDGWTDADEIRLGTDSLSANDKPVDSFEIVIPGTSIGLGAWDLIGIFGGIPLFVWISFGFLTRNSRCSKYEEMLKDARSREELEEVALKWEYSLMLRMLGPHQGIRLERLRAELDDKFENASFEHEEIGINHTKLVEDEQKEIPAISK